MNKFGLGGQRANIGSGNPLSEAMKPPGRLGSGIAPAKEKAVAKRPFGSKPVPPNKPRKAGSGVPQK